MAMYGLATLNFIKLNNDNSLTQKWYAEDGYAVGKLKSQRSALDNVIKHGKYFGYHTPLKCNEAIKVFKKPKLK